MNPFRLDNVPSTAAVYHADHHVGKMIEACQLMATAHIKPDVPGFDEMLPHCRLAATHMSTTLVRCGYDRDAITTCGP